MTQYQGIDGLRQIMTILRDKDRGCAWDRQQTFATISKYTIEEAYEVRDAIVQGDMDELKSELGDLLFQVIFHTQMAQEQGLFDFDDVCTAINDKMVRRHAHVFGDAKPETVDEINAMWDKIKVQEKAKKGIQSEGLALENITPSLPAIIRGQKAVKTAIKKGFDWETLDGVFAKIDEELGEIKTEISSGKQDRINDEMGDLFFCMIILATKLGLNAEASMNQGVSKFIGRFNAMERLIKQSGQTLDDASLEDMEQAWTQAKLLENKS